eukprot:5979258-Karenia_brevis.AAC.1
MQKPYATADRIAQQRKYFQSAIWPGSCFLGRQVKHGRFQDVPIVEATYVDDEALHVSGLNPKALDSAIEMLLRDLIATFNAHGFKITWAPRKSEAVLRYRGTGAKLAYESRIHD